MPPFPNESSSFAPNTAQSEDAPEASYVLYARQPEPRPRYWLHILLFALTLLSSTVVGARLNYNFRNDLPIFGSGEGPAGDAFPLRWAFLHPGELTGGLIFSGCLCLFFLAHEFGHYAYCRRHRVSATLPYFLPFPTVIGMFGAVIRIRSPFRTRRILFDIGVGGPIAGMIIALPLFFIGYALSKPLAASAADPDVVFGTPPLLLLAHHFLARLPGQFAQLQPHPVLLAGWVGLFATALNLIPGGQLDGGHILYAVRPQLHAAVSKLVAVALLLLGIFVYAGWALWGIILFLPWFRHPHVKDTEPLSRKQRWVALLALFLFLITFNPYPFHGQSAIDLVRVYLH